ncbi:Endonuclease/Exonuclease/phosphatase family [Geosmithia morbida]|uniref:Endonuclease/Exonuclease/phosphatase family n=1 Tax=Geosmithia morbida TaxID=1094350 RepID=A0A9P5D0Y6_9HYPO|nr:Endonuclease/Exonuclease/phosphatase family [Geosmithia morbida]KAF4122147.1 Endonuclease/Exonuclease/phosphatase family [Geosmithia morbida]
MVSLFSFLLASSLVVAAQALDLRLITHNVRQQTADLGEGEKDWTERVGPMVAQLSHEVAGNPDTLMCFQEAKHGQVEDLKSGLGNGWEYYGQGREGGEAGEYSVIFYRPSAFEILNSTTYWLSETPEEVSKGWDAAFERIVTVVRFRNKASAKEFVHMCTHFDHKGTEARQKSAQLILGFASDWSDGDGTPVFIGGDLNVDPENEAYATLTSELSDTFDQVSGDRHYGYNNTFTGFKTGQEGQRIDYIFSKNSQGIKFVSFAILHTYYNDFFTSDHRPVVVDAIVS